VDIKIVLELIHSAFQPGSRGHHAAGDGEVAHDLARGGELASSSPATAALAATRGAATGRRRKCARSVPRDPRSRGGRTCTQTGTFLSKSGRRTVPTQRTGATRRRRSLPVAKT
jgi:hypothetical protein